MAITDISAEIQKVWALYPPGGRSPAEVEPLLSALGEESNKLRERVDSLIIAGAGEAIGPVSEELRAFQGRLIQYEIAWGSAGSEAELAPALLGLWYRGEKAVPDAVFAPYLANQLAELEVLIDRNTLLRGVTEAVRELPERLSKAGAAIGTGASSLLGGLLTRAWWLIPLGFGFWYFTRRGGK